MAVRVTLSGACRVVSAQIMTTREAEPMDETAKTPAALGADVGTPAPVDDLVVLLSQKVVGQPVAV